MKRVDNTTLVQVIEQCFDLSLDGRFSQDDRSQFLAYGKRLRGSLVNLLSAEFKANTPKLLEANQKIKEVNARVAEVKAEIYAAAKFITDLGALVAVLDSLIALATSFV